MIKQTARKLDDIRCDLVSILMFICVLPKHSVCLHWAVEKQLVRTWRKPCNRGICELEESETKHQVTEASGVNFEHISARFAVAESQNQIHCQNPSSTWNLKQGDKSKEMISFQQRTTPSGLRAPLTKFVKQVARHKCVLPLFKANRKKNITHTHILIHLGHAPYNIDWNLGDASL